MAWFGADKENVAALGHNVAEEVAGIGELTHGFGQVNDGDAVACRVDIFLHLGVPTAGLMTEMTTGLHKIVNRDFTHLALPFLVLQQTLF